MMGYGSEVAEPVCFTDLLGAAPGSDLTLDFAAGVFCERCFNEALGIGGISSRA